MVLSSSKARRRPIHAGVCIFAAALTFSCWPALEAHAALTPDQAITRCLEHIRARYVSSGKEAGSFQMTLDVPTHANIDPYFALEAAVGVLAAHSRPNNPDAAFKNADLDKVGAFLLWYANRIQLQNKTDPDKPYGVAHEYFGLMPDPPVVVDDPFVVRPVPPDKLPDDVLARQTQGYDSIDSYAGLYLLACARYRKLVTAGFPQPAPQGKSVEWGIAMSINALHHVINKKPTVILDEDASISFSVEGAGLDNGLSIARGRAPVHYMLDNIETHAGLREIIPLFNSGTITQIDDNVDPKVLADGLVNRTGLPQFDGIAARGRYAYVVDGKNLPQFDQARKTDALSNLAALAYLPSKGTTKDGQVWQYLKDNYETGNVADDNKKYPPPDCPSERWLIAAKRVAPAEVAAFETTVTTNVESYQPITDIGRMGVTILALIDGPARYPVLSSDVVDPNIAVKAPADKAVNPH